MTAAIAWYHYFNTRLENQTTNIHLNVGKLKTPIRKVRIEVPTQGWIVSSSLVGFTYRPEGSLSIVKILLCLQDCGSKLPVSGCRCFEPRNYQGQQSVLILDNIIEPSALIALGAPAKGAFDYDLRWLVKIGRGIFPLLLNMNIIPRPNLAQSQVNNVPYA